MFRSKLSGAMAAAEDKRELAGYAHELALDTDLLHILPYRIELPPRFIVQRPVDKALDNNLLEVHPDDLLKLNVSFSRHAKLAATPIYHFALFDLAAVRG